jgi:GTP cyclohydrolase II
MACIGPHPQWFCPEKIVSMDPWGHLVQGTFGNSEKDIRPTIAVTRANMRVSELDGLLQCDGKIVQSDGTIAVTKIAIDPVWYLPGVAKRFGITELALRRALFEETGGMYPELVTRPDLKVFLPPIGGLTAYVFGDVEKIANSELTVRVHDECNGSDVFGSDICTCRPYLVYGIQCSVERAQKPGGAGLVVYFRKEGRALGEVTKFLVYNARKRQEGGDRASTYFKRTENVAGVTDSRFQSLMPDILHWLGIRTIHEMVSMSNMKYDAILNAGISILERKPIPTSMLPPDSCVEMEAKVAAGYFSDKPQEIDLENVKGRSWN